MRKFLISASIIYSGFLGISLAGAETVKWYSDYSLYDTTTCQTGGDIDLPTAPTKRGYTFNGWVPAYDLSKLNTSPNGNVYYAIVNTGTCYYRTADMSSYSTMSCSDSNYSDLTAGHWKTKFSYGTVYGDSKCSTTTGTYAKAGDPVDTAGKQCWCRATGFIPDGENTLYESPVSCWVFRHSYGSTSECASYCSYGCGSRVRSRSDFRAGLFGSVAN